MISLTTVFWALAGVLMGGMHSLALQHSSVTAHPWVALHGLLRLALVGGLLTVAAMLGYLFSAFAGWVIGLVLTLFLVAVRME